MNDSRSAVATWSKRDEEPAGVERAVAAAEDPDERAEEDAAENCRSIGTRRRSRSSISPAG